MTTTDALPGPRTGRVPVPVLVHLDPDDVDSTLRAKVLAGLEGADHDVVIDLREVLELTNSGVGVLVGARARQRARHQRLTVVIRPGSAVDHAMARAGLRPLFHVIEDARPRPHVLPS